MDTPGERIRQEALRLGFSLCGFAACEPLDAWRDFYTGYIQQQKHAGFAYLERYLEQRLNPRLLLPSARSVIALMLNYFPEKEIPAEDNFIISRYAYGREYQPVLKERMDSLISVIHSLVPGTQSKRFADSGPVLEKVWAQRCGVGWQGKNSLVINKAAGSYFFLGIILTSLELEPDPAETDHCGDCRRCQEACPTGALHTAHQVDIRRCLSYYNIENKEACPESLHDKFQGLIFGCDICQEACPWNRFATPTAEGRFSPYPDLLTMRKGDWRSLTPEKFDEIFAGTAIKRTGYYHFMEMIRINSIT